MNCKNTAHQLFNILTDIYQSIYQIIFLEVCKAYQIIPDVLFVSKKPFIGKQGDGFLYSWGKELGEVLIEEYVQKLS